MSEPVEVAFGDTVANGRWGDYLDIAVDPDEQLRAAADARDWRIISLRD